jgi:hypothetical protein
MTTRGNPFGDVTGVFRVIARPGQLERNDSEGKNRFYEAIIAVLMAGVSDYGKQITKEA